MKDVLSMVLWSLCVVGDVIYMNMRRFLIVFVRCLVCVCVCVCVCGHTTRPVVGLFGGVIFHLGFDMSQYVLEEIVLFFFVL
jgi:hypothetical protein